MQIYFARYIRGASPENRLKAVLKALSDVYPKDRAMVATDVAWSLSARSASRIRHSDK